jgi:hypothetical protein
LGLTEEEAATAAGVTVKTWRKWEKSGPARVGHLGPLDFAARFDVSIDWLFYGDGENIGSHLAKHASGVVAILPRGKGCPIPKKALRKKGRTATRAQRRKAGASLMRIALQRQNEFDAAALYEFEARVQASDR